MYCQNLTYWTKLEAIIQFWHLISEVKYYINIVCMYPIDWIKTWQIKKSSRQKKLYIINHIGSFVFVFL